MDHDKVLQTNVFLTSNQSFQRSLDYQELQIAIPYLANSMICLEKVHHLYQHQQI